MQPVHDVGVETGRNHEHKPPPIQESDIEPPLATLSDQSGHGSTVAGNPKVSGQQVFGSERQDGQRHVGESVDEIPHRSVTPRCHQANQAGATFRLTQMLGKPGAA
jgi:hypothetical protein